VKMMSLVVLIIQNVTLVLLLRSSRTAQGPIYLSSTAVVMSELLKTFISCAVVMYTTYTSHQSDTSRPPSPSSSSSVHLSSSSSVSPCSSAALTSSSSSITVSYLLDDLYRQSFSNMAEFGKMCVPAAIYAVQNNLLFLALENLEVATYQVLYQLKVLTTAVFAVVMLRKSLNRTKWTSLGLLFIGVAMVQLSSSSKGSERATQGNAFVGLLAVLAASCSSGFAGVYFEKVLKESRLSLWVRNIQLGLAGFVCSVLLMIMNDGAKLAENGFFYGYNSITWLVILNQSFGGLVVAVVVKYADNIIKSFANAVSIVLGCICSVYLFGFELTLPFTLGASTVVGAVYLYGYESPKTTTSRV